MEAKIATTTILLKEAKETIKEREQEIVDMKEFMKEVEESMEFNFTYMRDMKDKLDKYRDAVAKMNAAVSL